MTTTNLDVASPYQFWNEQGLRTHRLERVQLQMRPEDVPQSWESFRRPYGIALDGYLNAGPCLDQDVPCVNFDHHQDVDRLATRSTSGQVLLAIRLGLFHTFADRQGPRADVFVNDCDEDVALSWFLLKYGSFTEQVFNPALNRLVSMVDVLDATAGAYPFPADLGGLQELAWIYAPYREIRLSGELDNRDRATYVTVLDAVEERLIRHLCGYGERQPLDTRYRVIDQGHHWVMVEELGAQARIGMFADGIRAFVSVRRRPSGIYTYTLGRMSGFIPFDVLRILEALNVSEGLTGQDCWGGSQFVGGSPRLAGSRLSPRDVTAIVNQVIGSVPSDGKP
jgi:hypothetical protein